MLRPIFESLVAAEVAQPGFYMASADMNIPWHVYHDCVLAPFAKRLLALHDLRKARAIKAEEERTRIRLPGEDFKGIALPASGGLLVPDHIADNREAPRLVH